MKQTCGNCRWGLPNPAALGKTVICRGGRPTVESVKARDGRIVGAFSFDPTPGVEDERGCFVPRLAVARSSATNETAANG